MSLVYTRPLSGNCPIQAEGLTSCGKPWYFRARDEVSLTVGTGNGHPLDSTIWSIDEGHPACPPFETLDYPGWSSHESCEAWIEKALMCFEAWKLWEAHVAKEEGHEVGAGTAVITKEDGK